MENVNRRNLYLVTLSISMAIICMGASSAWPTPVVPKFANNETDVEIDKHELATMFALNPIGFAIGSLASRYIADRFGRRATILGSALPITIGTIIVVFAMKAWQLFITALAWSCGTGMISTVNNYYLSEVADKDIRGSLSVFTSFMFRFGILLVMTVGPFLSYRILNILMLIFPALFFLACWWIPETPYFYLKAGNLDGARKSLRILRGYKDAKVLEDELQALQSQVKNEMSNSSSFKELFVGPRYRKAIIIAAGLKLTQIMTGEVVIRHYLGWIISETKLQLQLSTVIIIYAAISFVVGMMSSALVYRVGRRPLLVWSYAGTAAALGSVGAYFFLLEVVQVDSATLTTFGFVPLLGIVLANVISTVGFNSLIFIIPAEIFPLNIKAVAMTSLSIFGSVLAVLVSKSYQWVKDLCGLTTVFWIFATFALGGSLFSYFFIIETKGKDLRDIQAELQGALYEPVEINDKPDEIVSGNDEREGFEMEELRKNPKD